MRAETLTLVRILVIALAAYVVIREHLVFVGRRHQRPVDIAQFGQDDRRD